MKATERFTGRSQSYAKFRPSYPAELFRYFRDELQWDQSKKIADIGAGTGIFTGLLLEQGYEVVAVEPNADMRQQLLKQLQLPQLQQPQLWAKQQSQLQLEAKQTDLLSIAEVASNNQFPIHRSIIRSIDRSIDRLTVSDGQAELTGLADASVDGIVCAQSFHWFDSELARKEFSRVLVPQGLVALLWNQREVEAAPFMQGYEALFMKYVKEYKFVKHKELNVQQLTHFFGGIAPTLKSFSYEQKLDKAGLYGRIASSCKQCDSLVKFQL